MEIRPEPSPVRPGAHDAPVPAFAHESEAELARILDFYAVAWEYEPYTFPILWNSDGDVLESFAPDFYLPDLDLYVELTTLRQRLVRKKNRKLRRLRELYPDVRIKLLYARDFRALMLKYGKLALVDELSGALGQVMPTKVRDAGAIAGQRLEPADAPSVLLREPLVAPGPQAAAGPQGARVGSARSERRRRGAVAGPAAPGPRN